MKFARKNNSSVTRRGVILVMLIPLAFVLFALVVLIVRLASLAMIIERAQLTADAVMLSSLAVRADALHQLADKAIPIEQLILSAQPSGVQVPAADWRELLLQGDAFKKSIPGYKGHITSTVGVVLEANRVKRNVLVVENSEAFQLGVQADGGWVEDETGQRMYAPSLWAKRIWRQEDRARLEVTFPTMIGAVSRASQGALRWDCQQGNGGYPLGWDHVVQAGKFRPYRYPYFRAVLVGDE